MRRSFEADAIALDGRVGADSVGSLSTVSIPPKCTVAVGAAAAFRESSSPNSRGDFGCECAQFRALKQHPKPAKRVARELVGRLTGKGHQAVQIAASLQPRQC